MDTQKDKQAESETGRIFFQCHLHAGKRMKSQNSRPALFLIQRNCFFYYTLLPTVIYIMLQ